MSDVGRYRKLYVRLFRHPGFTALTDAEKLLAIYLFTGPQTTRYGIRGVEGDKYAPGFVMEGYRRHRITYKANSRDTSATYLELLPLVNAGAVVLLDLADLLRELRGLERRRGSSGRDRVDHRPGAHDDRAVACAGALVLAGARKKVSSGLWPETEAEKILTARRRFFIDRGIFE